MSRSVGWEDFTVGRGPEPGLRPLGESGWHMLLCWAAGPAHVVRLEDRPEAHQVIVTTRSLAYSTPRTPADQAVIEEEINGYLAQAAVPDRPPGFAWYLRVSEPRRIGELIEMIGECERGHRELRPANTLSCMRAAVESFYAAA